MYNYFYEENLEERRHGKYALVIYLPEELDSIIFPLRERFDPIYNLIASHVTVVFPFESQHSLDDLTGIIDSVIQEETPFNIELDSIGDFYPQAPVIYWKVKRNDRLINLYYRLYSHLEMPIPYKEYLPHVTVAREISDYRVLMVKEKIVPYLPDEEFTARAVDLITPLSGNKWVSVRTFTLKE